ncbi:tetratricopeptide repeat protein [Roseiarcus fermentans]|uniref:Tetratricopeptide repeat protein n=1 Tax=Roseiarcus fermentans TaxID=1473586 RepID=A0A366FV66_9HYPH|nr:tetratricopeptide repeat protein [Roseiarcus fermentans]RBP17589.1 tetratricopeptide repeat protein [Roseiarcus fermentans]
MLANEDRALRFAEALRALADGDGAKAADIAQALLQRWPEDASVHQLMAAVALRGGRPAEAERWALSSLDSRPDHFATLMLAAHAARARGDWPGALARLRRAAELEPTRPEAAFGAAIASIAVDPGQAQRVFDDLLRRFPDPVATWAEVGDALERSGQRELAARAFAMALRAQPTVKLLLRFGSALHALGRRGEAAGAYRKALELDPASAEAWFKLGLAFQDGRRPDRAAEAYRSALALRPDLAEAETNLGVVLQEQGELAAAKQAYGRAIALMPSAFGRVAQALTTSPKGELWMDLGALRAHLSELGRLSR